MTGVCFVNWQPPGCFSIQLVCYNIDLLSFALLSPELIRVKLSLRSLISPVLRWVQKSSFTCVPTCMPTSLMHTFREVHPSPRTVKALLPENVYLIDPADEQRWHCGTINRSSFVLLAHWGHSPFFHPFFPFVICPDDMSLANLGSLR